MEADDLKALRERLGLTEEEMAKRVGLNLVRYLSMEAGNERITRLHILALERVGLNVATERKNPELAPTSIRRAALRFAAIVLEQNRPALD